MIVQINQLSENDFVDWEKFYLNHPQRIIYQSPDMFRFYTAVEGYFPEVIIIRTNNDELVGVLLVLVIKLIKVPFNRLSSWAVVYGGPLISTNSDKEILNNLLSALNRYISSRVSFIQFRNYSSLCLNDKDIFIRNGFNCIPWTNIRIQTQDKDKVNKGISKSRLRQIKTAFQSGNEIRSPYNISEVKELYLILKTLYTKKLGKPLPPFSFFENFYNHSLQGKLGLIKIVVFNEKVIGGMIAPVTDNLIIHEWYISGSDKIYKQNYPSVAITWDIIEFAVNNQIEYFDFMGSGNPESKNGVRDFKQGFCNEIINTCRYEKSYLPCVKTVYSVLLNIIGKLKTFIHKFSA